MKILYVCSADLTGESGSMGSVRHIMEVSENLCKLGNKVVLVAPLYGRYPHPTPVSIFYIPVLPIRFIRTLMHEFLAVFYLLAFFVFWRPDIVYWRQAYLTFFPVLLSHLFGKKILAEINGLTLDEIESESISWLRKKVILAFEKFNYNHADHLISVAPRIQDRVLTHYGLPELKATVILNGVNADRMPVMDGQDAKAAIGLDPKTPVVGFVGHFFPWDGIEILIKSAPEIIRHFNDVRFVIVGHGRWGRHLPDLAKKYGVDKNFIFTGKIQWEDLYKYVNAFDVATAPYSAAVNTTSGRSSLKILEYFACQKPVVASKTEVIPEILDLDVKGLGLTVPSENPKALAEAIIRLLGDPAQRKSMGLGGREYVIKQRSWKAVAQKTNQILIKLKAGA